MIPHLFFSQRVLIALVWVFLMLDGLWPWEPAAVRPPPPTPVTPPRKRSCVPQPFIRFHRIPTKQKRHSTGQGAKSPLDPQRPEKKQHSA